MAFSDKPEKIFRRQALKRLMTLQSQGGKPLSMTDTL